MQWPLLWRVTLTSSLVASIHATKTCYLPNGEVAVNDQPCFPENPQSACCGGSTYVCATNNMCAYFDASYYVIGSCTDKTWNSPACPSYCFFRDHVHNTVFRCSADTYCCADGPTCNCTTGANTQKIRDFLPEYSVLVGSSVALDTTVATSSLLTPIGASRTPTTTSSSTSPSTLASTAGTSTFVAATTTVTATTHPSSLAESASPTPTPQNAGVDNGLKIGLGVGIPLGAVAIALVVILLVMQRRWRRRQLLTEMNRSSQPVFQPAYPGRSLSEFHKHNLYAELRQTHIFEGPGDETHRI